MATQRGIKLTRKERTTEFNEKVEKEWKATYLEFIKEYIVKPEFNYHNLTSNPNIDPQVILDNPHLRWDYSRVIERLDIPIETLITKYGTELVFLENFDDTRRCDNGIY